MLNNDGPCSWSLSLSMFKKMIFLLLSVLPLFAAAQQVFSGKVYDLNDKKMPLPNALVRNLSTGKSTMSQAQGNFSLPAKVGELIEVSFVGYHTDTLYLINLSARTIYLPANSTRLKEVAILGAKVNPLVLSPDPEARVFKRFENDALNGKGNNDRVGGLKFNLGYGKYKRKQEKLEADEERDFYEAEINQTFTAEYVSKLTKLKGDDLKNFMSIYRPSALLVGGQRPFNYDFYTVKAYHTWLKLPEAERKLQAIPKLKNN